MNTDIKTPHLNLLPMRPCELLVGPHGRLERPAPIHVSAEMEWLPTPDGHAARLLNGSLLVALADRDGRWAATCLRLAAKQLSHEEQIFATWMPLVVGAALLERKEWPLFHGEEALGALCSLIRDMFGSAPPEESTTWIMPAEDRETDRAAAHLAAACLSVRGTEARPWLWNTIPTTGRCIRCGCTPSANHELPTFSVLPVAGLVHLYGLCMAGC